MKDVYQAYMISNNQIINIEYHVKKSIVRNSSWNIIGAHHAKLALKFINRFLSTPPW